MLSRKIGEKVFLMCFLLCLVLPVEALEKRSNALAVSDTDSIDLFKQVFGKQPARLDVVFSVQLVIDGYNAGEVTIKQKPYSQSFSMSKHDLLGQLEQFVATALVVQIRNQTVEDSFVSAESCRQLDIELTLKKKQMRLYVETPRQFRKRLYSESGDDGFLRDYYQPSPISGFVNLYGTQTYLHEVDERFSPLQLVAEGAVNREQLVFKFKGLEQSRRLRANTLDAEQESTWIWESLSLLYDNYKTSTRFEFGDLFIKGTGFMSSQRLWGVGSQRFFSLNPTHRSKRVRRQTIYLHEPSIVEMRLNGVLLEHHRLPKGNADFLDIPLKHGVNRVEFAIYDLQGEELKDTKVFYMIDDNRTLAPGVSEFSYNLGVPTRIQNFEKEYDANNLTLSLSHRQGMTNTVMLAPFFQMDHDQLILGSDSIFLRRLGLYNVNASYSSYRRRDNGVAVSVFFESYPSPKKRNVVLATQFQSKSFAQLGQYRPINPTAFELNGSLVQRPFRRLRFHSSGSVKLNRDEETLISTVGTAFGSSLRIFSMSFKANAYVDYSKAYKRAGVDFSMNREGTWFTSSFFLRVKKGTSVDSPIQVGLNMAKRFGQDRHMANVRVRNTSTGLDYQFHEKENDFFSSFRMTRSTDPSLTASGEMMYRDSFSNLRVKSYLYSDDVFQKRENSLYYRASRGHFEYNYFKENTLKDAGTQLSRLHVGTAIAFAGSTVALSQPIKDSFVIVSRHPALRKTPVVVNNRFVSDSFGPVVLPNLQPLSETTVRIDTPELPADVDVGKQIYKLKAKHYSGYAIQIGQANNLSVSGTLVDKQGVVQAFKVFNIRSLDGKITKMSFSGRNGAFSASGFLPGKYEMVFLQELAEPIAFTIDETEQGVVLLGELIFVSTEGDND